MPTGRVIDGRSGQALADVCVSDGLVVTRTLDDGSFAIPERSDAEFVSVTVPSSHHALRDGWFADVRGGASSPLHFELEPRDGETSAGCRFVQVTDLHVSVDDGARLRPMIEAGVDRPPGVHVTGQVTAAELRADLEAILARVVPDFVAATGDLADYGQREELEGYRQAITGLGVPVASVPGNHDHLSCLTRQAIEEFFAGWSETDDPEGLGASEAFQRAVFGGDWRRLGSGRAPWVEVMGPLYYSFDWGGTHFVVYDGEGRRRYGDDYPQDRWLEADLANVDTDTPVVVLTHFPEDREFYRSRFSGVRLLASLSGHWHGMRTWRDGDAVHWTSSTVGFGGTDFTPRGFRVIETTADGVRSSWETMERPRLPSARVTGAAVSRAGGIVVAFESVDGGGSVRSSTGWTCELPVAPRGGLAADDELLYLLDPGARLVALDARTGDERWSAELGDASERWCFSVPTPVGDRLFAGSPVSVHAFDARTGTERWRTDIAHDDVAASFGGVAVGDDVVVIGGVSEKLHIAALDRASGAIRWHHAGRDIAGVTATPVIRGDRVLAVRAPGWLTAYALGDGALRWDVPLDDSWPVALAIEEDVALVRSATGRVTAHDAENGDVRWEQPLGTGPRANRPYGRTAGGDRLPLVVDDGRVWTAAFDALIGLDLGTGDVASRVGAGSEVATVVAGDGEVLAVTIDGQVVTSRASA